MNCRKCKAELPTGAVYCPFCGIKQQLPPHKVKQRGNGQGTVYQLPNKTWKVQVTLGYTEDKKRIAKTKSGFKTKKEALAFIPTLLGNYDRNQKTTLATLYTSWSKSYLTKLSDSKQTSYEIAYKKIKDIAYRDITTLCLDDLQKIVDKSNGEYYPKKDIKTVLTKLYDRAMIDKIITINTAKYIELPPQPQSKKDAFNADEVKSFWNDYYQGHFFTAYILVMIYTGMRLGELQNLEDTMINLKLQVIIGAGIKSDTGKDTPIVIANKILPIIESLMGHEKPLRMNEDNFYKQYYETLERCHARRLTPHCCRHTTATALALENIAPAIIKQIMRHTNYKTTTGYTHIDTTAMLAAINKI